MSVQRFKWPYHFKMGIVLVLLYLLTACSVYRPSSEGASAPLTPSPLVVPPSATSPLLPSPLPATATPSPTHTSAPPTVTPRPVLTVDERRALARWMLETNGDCELPCWWGITPGETRWQEVVELLGLRGTDLHKQGGGVYDIMYVPLDPYRLSDYGVRLIITEYSEVVQSIGVQSEMFVGRVSEHFARDWRRYSLNQVLTRYGEPSQVMLELWPNPPEPYYPYRLFVFYDHLGILLGYEGPAIPGEPFRVCTKFEQVTQLRLWLQSPKQQTSLLQLANLDSGELAQMLPLEKATGMTLKTFYETFKDAESQVCMESPASVWPSH